MLYGGLPTKWVNPVLNIIGVNLLKLGGLHIHSNKYKNKFRYKISVNWNKLEHKDFQIKFFFFQLATNLPCEMKVTFWTAEVSYYYYYDSSQLLRQWLTIIIIQVKVKYGDCHFSPARQSGITTLVYKVTMQKYIEIWWL